MGARGRRRPARRADRSPGARTDGKPHRRPTARSLRSRRRGHSEPPSGPNTSTRVTVLIALSDVLCHTNLEDGKGEGLCLQQVGRQVSQVGGTTGWQVLQVPELVPDAELESHLPWERGEEEGEVRRTARRLSGNVVRGARGAPSEPGLWAPAPPSPTCGGRSVGAAAQRVPHASGNLGRGQCGAGPEGPRWLAGRDSPSPGTRGLGTDPSPGTSSRSHRACWPGRRRRGCSSSPAGSSPRARAPPPSPAAP